MQCTSGVRVGPLGFIAYTDDLTAVSEKHSVRCHMYADDTQLYDSSSLVDAESVRDHLTSCLSEVAKWCAPISKKISTARFLDKFADNEY